MDFSSFNLQDTGDLFKQNYQLNTNNNNTNNTHDNSTDFFNFMDNGSDTNINHGSFTVPQLSPDGHEASFTNSSVLSGHNPEFNMSPLQIASQPSHSLMQTYHTPLQTSHVEEFVDDEEFFTPLVSPAMAPTYNDAAYHSLVSMKNHENIFSPLSSPALNPSSSSTGDQSSLQQKLAFIERQQQQLRNMHNQLRPTASPKLNSNGYTSPLISYQEPKKSLKKLVSSPRPFAIPKSAIKCESPLALKPMTPHTSFVNKSPNIASSTSASSSISSSSASSSSTSKSNNYGFIAPATPSLLMKLGNGNHTSATINTSPSTSSSSVVDNMPILPAAMLQQEELNEPKRRRISNPSPPSLHHQNDILASPASLRPQQSPRALKPLISPSLKPNGKRLSSIEEETARALLTSKSNYENLKEGKAKSLGIDFSTTIQSGIENRRSAHKAAEQKRRDTLKQSFDSLRTEIIDAMMEEELAEQQDSVDNNKEEEIRNTKEKDVKQMSKVVLLQHSYEYILRLKSDNKRKDEKQAKMRQELIALRKQLGLPETTKEEEEAEEKERLEEKEKRQARLKRLQSVAAAGDEASST
ncbi:hypothetical protein BD770DRAFT_410840 [Pilaira anomala]|nr:hypothetical protein BD770DRAFT_410840 [Pilaira anomala]